ncbi:MAG: hypothetical protein R3B48_08915 [Kofleriaceae bacterium]
MDFQEVTVADLEQVISSLRLGGLFSFGQAPLNQPHGRWDVLPLVERIDDLEPADHGDANEFLAWTDAAADAAFDDAGVLRAPFVMQWAGSRADLQTAFADAGLTVRIDLDDEPRAPYLESGTLLLSPRSRELDCDLRILLRTFAALEPQGIVALANAGYTQSDGWSDVAERALTDDASAVFWHAQKHEAFDGVGNLGEPLLLHWRGDGEVIVAALRAAGFAVEDPPPEHTCIAVRSGPTGAVPLEQRAPAPARPSATAAARVLSPQGGPLEQIGALRSRDPQPVTRLAFDARRPQRLAFAQELDNRGFPTAPAYLADLDAGTITDAILEDQRCMGVGGLSFLRDGRLLVCTTQQRRANPEDELPSSALVLHAWTPGHAHELLCQRFSHITNTSLLTLDDGGCLAAIGQPRGADLYLVPPPGEPWPSPERELRLADEPIRAYTRTGISPDGSCVAWCDDWSAPLACFDRASGEVRWRHRAHHAHRGKLAFSPDSSLVALRIAGHEVESMRLELFAADDGRAVGEGLTAASRGVRAFAFHPSGELVAIGRDRGSVSLYRLGDGSLVAEAQVLASGHVAGLAFRPDGARLVVGGSKGDVGSFAFTEGGRTSALAPAAAAEPPRRSCLASKGRHPLVGVKGVLVDGAFRNHDATVVEVGSGGRKLRVSIVMLGRAMTIDAAAADFRRADDLGAGSAASPHRVGDRVFVHDGYRARGREATIIDVEEASAQATVELPQEHEDDDPEDLRDTVKLDELTPVDPLRRDLVEAYLEVLDRKRFRCGEQRPLQHWALRALRAVAWNLDHPSLAADGDLAREYAVLEAETWDAAVAAHERRRAELIATYQPLTAEQRLARWQTEWQRWSGCRHIDLPRDDPEWKDIDGGDVASRRRLDAVFALRERLKHKPW